jgi:hypothetical protein
MAARRTRSHKAAGAGGAAVTEEIMRAYQLR